MELYEIKLDMDCAVSFIFDGNVYTYSETPSMHAHSLYEIVYILSDQAVIELEQTPSYVEHGRCGHCGAGDLS